MMKWNKNASSQKGRVFRSGLLSTAMLAAVLVLAVLLNLLVRAIPTKYTEFDLSEAKMYTLSDSTKALVEGLEKDVHIYYLCETGSEDAIITKLLDHYAAESGHLSWEQKDPTLYPTFAAKYGTENVSTGSLIVTCGENSTVLDAAVSSELLKNIFFVKAPMHDGAVIVRHGRVLGAGCMLPLSKNVNLSRDLGMRHRAGIGMSENSDAVVVIVSEETGSISVAIGGMLKRHLKPETLENLLRNELLPREEDSEDRLKFNLLNLLRSKKNGGEEDA